MMPLSLPRYTFLSEFMGAGRSGKQLPFHGWFEKKERKKERKVKKQEQRTARGGRGEGTRRRRERKEKKILLDARSTSAEQSK